MFPYLIVLGATSAAALTSTRSRSIFFAALIVLIVFVGLRFHVGKDWNSYLLNYKVISYLPILTIITGPEFGVGLLYWIGRNLGGGFVLVNAISAIVFCVGLFAFAWRTKEPFLALTIACPYLVFVIAMSVTRQAMALGVIFYLFATWERRSTASRTALVLIAALCFHTSALFMLIFVALGTRFSMAARVSAVVAVVVIGLLVTWYLPSRVSHYEESYFGGKAITASGALPHVLLVAIPAAVYLLARRRWAMIYGRDPSLDALAIASVLLVPAVYVSSVAADRMSLYFWPVAMYVGAGWTGFISSPAGRVGYRLLVIAGSFTVALGWFLLANSSWAYIPYKNYLVRPEGESLARPRPSPLR